MTCSGLRRPSNHRRDSASPGHATGGEGEQPTTVKAESPALPVSGRPGTSPRCCVAGVGGLGLFGAADESDRRGDDAHPGRTGDSQPPTGASGLAEDQDQITETSGLTSVNPGCEATSVPACSAFWSRKNDAGPAITAA